MKKGKTTSVSRTDSELQEDSKIVLYEFDALCQTANLLRGDVKKDRVLNNACIESFGIHCRAIIKFLFGHSADTGVKFMRYQTDVLAIHYFYDEPDRWTNMCPKAGQHLIDAKEQADKQIAHITTDRRGLNQSPNLIANWEIGEDLASLGKVMLLFVNEVPETRLAEGVKEALRKLVRGIDHVTSSGFASPDSVVVPDSVKEPHGSLRGQTAPDKSLLDHLVSTTDKTE